MRGCSTNNMIPLRGVLSDTEYLHSCSSVFLSIDCTVFLETKTALVDQIATDNCVEGSV